MLRNIFFFTILIYLATRPLASSNPARFPLNSTGLTASLIPPTSPRSPFYSDILAANNFPPRLSNITLNRTHYEKWLLLTKSSSAINDDSEVTYNTNAHYHVMDLYLGNPAQRVYGIFDTGSDIAWTQCERKARITTKYAYYRQSKSDTYKVVACNDKVRCQSNRRDMGCNLKDPKATSCNFFIFYFNFGYTLYAKGVMSSDIISFKPTWEILHDFVFGCTLDDTVDAPGVIGASNSVYSIPKQIFHDDPKFSYCIPSDFSAISFVKFGTDAMLTGLSVKVLRHRIKKYYYMDVIGVQVNGEEINVPASVFTMSSDGNTGFIIDSGTSITSFSPVAFDALKDKVYRFLGHPTSHHDLDICYPSSTFGSMWRPYRPRPTIGIEFRDDSVFDLRKDKVWKKMEDTNLECLQIMRLSKPSLSVLGAEQLYDVNVGHDPKNNLLYLQHHACPIVG